MIVGLIPVACCSGHDNAQTASMPPSAERRTPVVAVTSPVPSSKICVDPPRAPAGHAIEQRDGCSKEALLIPS